MLIRILAIDKEIYSGEADSVTLPSSDGQITVLANHLPVISLLKAGKIVVRKKDKVERELEVRGGFVEVHPEKTTVLVE